MELRDPHQCGRDSTRLSPFPERGEGELVVVQCLVKMALPLVDFADLN
jgi:hypothetical protein